MSLITVILKMRKENHFSLDAIALTAESAFQVVVTVMITIDFINPPYFPQDHEEGTLSEVNLDSRLQQNRELGSQMTSLDYRYLAY